MESLRLSAEIFAWYVSAMNDVSSLWVMPLKWPRCAARCRAAAGSLNLRSMLRSPRHQASSRDPNPEVKEHCPRPLPSAPLRSAAPNTAGAGPASSSSAMPPGRCVNRTPQDAASFTRSSAVCNGSCGGWYSRGSSSTVLL